MMFEYIFMFMFTVFRYGKRFSPNDNKKQTAEFRDSGNLYFMIKKRDLGNN